MTAVETWHKANNDLMSTALFELLESVPRHARAAAYGLLTAIHGWCSAHRVDTVRAKVVSGLAGYLAISRPQVTTLTEAMVSAGYLAPAADGFVVTDKSIIWAGASDETPAPSSRPSESTQRVRERNKKREQRAKAKGQASSVPDSSPVVPDVSPGTAAPVPTCPSNVPDVSPVVPGDRGAPPSQTLPPRTGTNTSTGTHPPPSPPAQASEPAGAGGGGGAAVEASGVDKPATEAKPAADAALKTPPSEPADADGESATDPADAKDLSAAAKRRLRQIVYAEAYVKGVIAATGREQPAWTTPFELDALGTLLTNWGKDDAGKAFRGDAALSWLTEQARMYATIRAGRGQFEGNFRPSKCVDWFRDGKTAPSPGMSPRARGQQIVPQPADPGPFQPSFAPMTLDDLRAEKARQKEAAAAKAAGRLP